MGDIHADWPQEQQLEIDQLTRAAHGEILTLKSGLKVMLCPNELAKVLVPSGRRQALIEREHATSQHAGWKKVYSALSRTYWWPGMSTQVKRVVQACNACALNNGRRNLAHGQFNSVQPHGPRLAYAIDFYEVATSTAGFCWILTIIDLFSHEVIFVPCKSREAAEVVRALLRHVINKKGAFLVLMCDEAKEFVGKLVGGLCKAMGAERISTKSYNPRANATCETVHRFLGKCLVRLDEAERESWEEHLEEFAFAHNCAFHESIGCSPFEIEHGSAARTLTSALCADDFNLDDCNADSARGYFGRVKIAAKQLQDLASAELAEAQAEQNKRLNQGSYVKVYEVGDIVSIYCPERGIDSEWKPKHLHKWRGPMEITEKLAATVYRMREHATGRNFERTVANINTYRADPDKAPTSLSGGDTTSFKVGDFLATLDNVDSKEIWLAQVTALTEDGYSVHYWATCGSKWATAVFKPAYVGTHRQDPPDP